MYRHRSIQSVYNRPSSKISNPQPSIPRQDGNQGLDAWKQEKLNHLSTICSDTTDPVSMDDFNDLSKDELERIVAIGSDKKKHCYLLDNIWGHVKATTDRNNKQVTDPLNPSHKLTIHELNEIYAKMKLKDPSFKPPIDESTQKKTSEMTDLDRDAIQQILGMDFNEAVRNQQNFFNPRQPLPQLRDIHNVNRVNERVNERVNNRVNERVNNRVNERVNNRITNFVANTAPGRLILNDTTNAPINSAIRASPQRISNFISNKPQLKDNQPIQRPMNLPSLRKTKINPYALRDGSDQIFPNPVPVNTQPVIEAPPTKISNFVAKTVEKVEDVLLKPLPEPISESISEPLTEPTSNTTSESFNIETQIYPKKDIQEVKQNVEPSPNKKTIKRGIPKWLWISLIALITSALFFYKRNIYHRS